MQRNNVYYSNSYNMDEYFERLDRIQRMPSLVGEYPSFPNVYEVLHNKKVSDKKVYFFEHGKKKPEVGKIDVKEKSMDAAADGFIKQKRKGFTLCEWDTYRVY